MSRQVHRCLIEVMADTKVYELHFYTHRNTAGMPFARHRSRSSHVTCDRIRESPSNSTFNWNLLMAFERRARVQVFSF